MDQNDRPRFFEGQYLGAADLDGCVDYTRIRSARHELGAHVWGIVTGLELVEQPLASGAVQVTITPGCAWDGYGRPVAVLAPELLSADLFRNFVNNTAFDGDIVKIWLAYSEDESNNPQPGFEVCQGDQHARVAESFTVEAGELDATHNVVVAGRTLDAKAVRKAFNPAAPDLYDEAVPYQEIPDTGALPRWPILLGYVRWFKQGSAPGYIKPRNDAATPPDSDQIRALRRYIGVVAEELLGPDGRLRLRDRNKAPSPNYTAPATTTASDLLWVEGHTRIEGDLRLLGGQLEWRGTAASFADVPMIARRNEANPQGGKSLEVVFATNQPALQGKNRLVFGVAPKTNGDFGNIDAKMIIQDNGNVGIGTDTPDRAVTIQGTAGTYLNVKADNGKEEVLVGADGNGGILSTMTNHDLQLRAGGNSTKMVLQAGGNVGIGTFAPAQKLHVAGQFLRVDGVNGELAEFGSEGNQSVVIGTRDNSIVLAEFRNLTVPLSSVSATRWLTLYCHSVLQNSDARAKTKVQPLSGALSTLMQLRGVSYQWKDENQPARQLGLIAQEVQQVVPEAVSISERGAGISYSSLIPVLIEALKELKSEVDALQPLKEKCAQLEAELASLRGNGAGQRD